MALIFQDSFTDYNGVDLATQHNIAGGPWNVFKYNYTNSTIQDNGVQSNNGSTSTPHYYYLPNILIKNGYVSIEKRLFTGNNGAISVGGALLFRILDASNYYFLSYTIYTSKSVSISLQRIGSPSVFVFSTQVVVASSWPITIKVQFVGDVFTTYVNNIVVNTTTYSHSLNNTNGPVGGQFGGVGYYGQTQWDNFNVLDLMPAMPSNLTLSCGV